MATAEELLTAAATTVSETPASDVLIADLNTRTISVPANAKILGVEADDDVKRLHFSIPKMYGEFDLSEFDIRINFKNARNAGDVYFVEDNEVVGDNITFSWLVDRSAFLYPGDVKFNICLKKYDSSGTVVKELNTTIASVSVLEGLETEEAVVESNPSAFDNILYRLHAVEAASGLGQDSYYSIARVANSDDGIIVTIVNQEGTTEAVIRHGEDGYTPIKGEDYWTEDEEAEIKAEASSYARAYVDAWAPKTASVTLPADNWLTNHQSISVEGVTSDNIVIVSPETTDANYKEYADRGVKCIAQSDGRLTFKCVTTPTIDLVVNLGIYFSSYAAQASSRLTVTDDGEGNVTIA